MNSIWVKPLVLLTSRQKALKVIFGGVRVTKTEIDNEELRYKPS